MRVSVHRLGLCGLNLLLVPESRAPRLSYQLAWMGGRGKTRKDEA